MAIVKLYNLSEKVQVLVRKYLCEETNLQALSIETIIEYEDVSISGTLRSEYDKYEHRDEAFNNRTELPMLTKIANSIITQVLSDDEVEQYLIK